MLKELGLHHDGHGPGDIVLTRSFDGDVLEELDLHHDGHGAGARLDELRGQGRGKCSIIYFESCVN